MILLLGCITPFPARTFPNNPYHDYDADGFTEIQGDCDDEDAAVNPGADEVCDEIDDDCDGLADAKDDDTVDLVTAWLDLDGDGHGDPDRYYLVCDLDDVVMGDAVETGDDCDDTNVTVNPSMAETCGNGLDDNCDGSTNECGWDHWNSTNDAALTMNGTADGDALGAGACAADLDGDGAADLAVTAPGYDALGSSNGLVSIWSSSQEADDASPIAGATSWAVVPYSGLRFGGAIACADLADDGTARVIASAPSTSVAVEWPGGAVFLLDASGGEETPTTPRWESGALGDMLGRSLADGEALIGTPSVLLGASNNGDGALYLIDAASSGEVDDAWIARVSGDTNDNLGLYPPKVADLDCDGFDDLAVTAPERLEYGGLALVFHGPLAGDLGASDADLTLTGDEGELASLGASDLDQDGCADLVVGDEDRGDGAVLVYLHADFAGATTVDTATSWSFVAWGSDSENAGSDFTLPGDVDGDEAPDLVVGARSREHHRGGFSVLTGPWKGSEDLTAAAYNFAAEGGQARVGLTVRPLGDYAGDGPPFDFAVGGPGDGTPGVLYVFLGGLGY